MIAKVKNDWEFDDAYDFVTSRPEYETKFNELYPPDMADDAQDDLLDRVLRRAGDSGDQSIIEAILETQPGVYLVRFIMSHPTDDGFYRIYEFEEPRTGS